MTVSALLLVGMIAAGPPPATATRFQAVLRSLDFRQPTQRMSTAPALAMSKNAPDMIVRLRSAGDVASALRRSGVLRADADQASAMIDAAVFPDTIAEATDMRVTLGLASAGGAHLLERLTLRPRIDLQLSVTAGPTGLELTAHPIAVDSSPLEVRGSVGPDLGGSLLAARIPMAQVAVVKDALRDQLSPANTLRTSDRFELVFEQQRAVDGSVVTGNLLYAALRRDDRSLVEMVRSRDDTSLRDVGAPARGPGVPGSGLPINGRLTSRYGMRMHPIIGYTRLHAGIDVAAPSGAPVVAAARGTVSFAGWQGGHGNYVRLEHGPGLATGYAHLSRIAVVPGQSVLGGQIIGNVGSTGLSTGPHLHYEVFRGGRAVDPLRNGIFAASGDSARPSGFADAVRSLRALIRSPS